MNSSVGIPKPAEALIAPIFPDSSRFLAVFPGFWPARALWIPGVQTEKWAKDGQKMGKRRDEAPGPNATHRCRPSFRRLAAVASRWNSSFLASKQQRCAKVVLGTGLVRRVERLSDASPERSSSHVSRTVVAGHLAPSASVGNGSEQ